MSNQDDETQEAAEILTDLLANQSLSTNNATQVGEAQNAALQQLINGNNNVLNEQSVRALLDAMGGAEEGEKKHVFWDTQVRRNVEMVRICLFVFGGLSLSIVEGYWLRAGVP